MTLLYQFPISHYCEKARWALDHKDIKYQVKNLLPGPHIKQIKKIARSTEVPVLNTQGQCIQGSDNIIDYLDDKYPEKSLTPENDFLKKEAEDWETYANFNFGIPIRAIIYSHIIDQPEILISLWTRGGPWYGPLFYKLFFSKVQSAVREKMKLNDQYILESKKRIEVSFSELNKIVEGKTFLVGEHLSRADIAMASLLAPIVLPEKSYIRDYLPYPDGVLEYREAFTDEPLFKWVENMYQNHR
ncbi:MAG: glutathione S-transferase [Gammaproteobacteria bacterium]|nr:glutathione S-transferase [Gammaproteobacteria bacterium]